MKKRKVQELLRQRVLRFIRENGLIPENSRLLVAVSGGPDSVCLLHILYSLRDELKSRLHIAHLDHQLRGAESESDARYVSQLALKLGIPASIEARDVPAYRTRKRMTLEEAAREVRYSFLSEVAESVGADRVAVGHTSNDQVETILMHLVRGAGTTGLTGMKQKTVWPLGKNDLVIVRPLLCVSRPETLDYCNLHHLEPVTDTTNSLMSSFRNQVRHQLLPLLESYNPRVGEALLRNARIASDDIAFLDEQVSLIWESIARKPETALILDREILIDLPSGLQRHLLRRAITEMSGDLSDIEAVHIEAMLDILKKPSGKMMNLPHGLVFIVDYDRFLLTGNAAPVSHFPELQGEVTLNIPGETAFPGWRVSAEIINPEQMNDDKDDFVAYFDFDSIGEAPLVRGRKSGDRFQPLGMSQSKKLGEFMIDEKIPAAWRKNLPVVCMAGKILWVVGWRIDDRVKVTSESKRVLRLEFERIP